MRKAKWQLVVQVAEDLSDYLSPEARAAFVAEDYRESAEYHHIATEGPDGVSADAVLEKISAILRPIPAEIHLRWTPAEAKGQLALFEGNLNHLVAAHIDSAWRLHRVVLLAEDLRQYVTAQLCPHNCYSVGTPDGHGAFCGDCGETLE